MPAVSVIIPVYNTEKYLRRCLDSVCNQTLKDIEIICIDDGSTDGSAAILAECAAHDPRVKAIAFGQNRGAGAARNAGIDAAAGEYLGFVDGDDAIDLDFYRRLYDEARGNDADIVKAGVKKIDCGGKVSLSDLNRKIRRSGTRYGFMWQWSSAIYRRATVRRAGIRFAEGCPLGEDMLFLNQFLLASRGLHIVDDVFYHYYRREESGDSRILSSAKLKAGLGVLMTILENSLQLTETDRAGFEVIATSCLQIALAYALRADTSGGRQSCVDAGFEIYGLMRRTLGAELGCLRGALLTILRDFLCKDDREGMLQCLRVNDTQTKLFVANVRYLARLKSTDMT